MTATIQADKIGHDGDPPEGYEWEWVKEDREWFTADPLVVDGRTCRRMGPGHRVCGQPAVAAINRSHKPGRKNWWAYCKDHLYGRRIRNGVVEYQRAVKVSE